MLARGESTFGQALRSLRLPEDWSRLRRLARRLLVPERVRIPRGPPARPSPTLERLLSRDDRALDVALGAALIAHEDEPTLDIERLLDGIGDQAAQLRAKLRPIRGPLLRLEALNCLFFEELGYSASPTLASRRGEDRLADLLLPHVVRRRRGHCVGLSAIYLALAYQANLPVFGVSAPGHFFVRWEGQGLRRNIELTAGGICHPDAYYEERFKIAAPLIDRGVYLQNLRRREVLAEILNNRANFYWDRGDEGRTLRDLDRVVRISHNFCRAYAGRGFVALKRGAYERAETDLRRALDINPDYGRAHLVLGQVHLRRGALDDAARAFEHAHSLDPTSALAATYLGRTRLRQDDGQGALDWHRRAIKIDPRCITAWNHLGLAHQDQGDAEAAKEAFLQARRLAPDDMRTQENLVLLTRGDYDRIAWTSRPAFRSICSDYERRLGETPDADALRTAYVRFLMGAGLRLDRAQTLAERLAARTDSPAHHETLARVLALRGRDVAALEHVERALERDPPAGDRVRLQALREDLRRRPGGRTKR